MASEARPSFEIVVEAQFIGGDGIELPRRPDNDHLDRQCAC